MSVSLSRRQLIHVPKIIAEWKLLHISALPVPKNMLHYRTADKSMSQTGTVWSGKKVILQVAHKSCEERSTNHPVPQRFHLCQRVYLCSKLHTFKSSLHQSCCFFCSEVSSQHPSFRVTRFFLEGGLLANHILKVIFSLKCLTSQLKMTFRFIQDRA